MEFCCICNKRTSCWYVPKDVALCQGCAKTTRRADVPTKKEWFDRKLKRNAPLLQNVGPQHWRKEASKLVVECLVRASNLDTRSVIGDIAARRLIELAIEESPEFFKEVTDERDRCINNMNAIIAEKSES